MKLYLAPGACSLAAHIALHEAGIDFDRITVDLRAKRTEDGADFTSINPKGYVPTLVLDDGSTLTENVALLDWIAQRSGKPLPGGELGRTRLLEMLAFISTEVHKQFGRLFFPTSDAEKTAALDKVAQRLQYLAGQLKGDYLFGNEMSVADAYLYVMLRWADGKGATVPAALQTYRQRLEARPAVQLALRHEGLDAK
ncbi:glutathione binding-like protein [Aquincola tertiaricarbonis]|uniref:Glutathione binding-like protein n=1 Tax=Aquincola tertiaricarbonis TaxID=391953 RepID=A0ABY4SDT7_AQUTE|nr:glutathione binding-like protein [Aquincola tertiaricarbonis]URI11483.1 glutathione binding-like protein [Aquincola tertiaricarbonis]